MLGTTIYAAILALLTVLTLRKPYFALVAILCMFGLEQWGQIYSSFLRTNGEFTNRYILVLVLVAVALSYRSGRISLRIDYESIRIRFLSTLLFLYALTSLLWTPTNANALERWESAWPYLISNIILAPLLIGRIDDLQQAQKYFVWFGGAILLLLATIPEWENRSLVIAGKSEGLGLPLALAQLAGYSLIVAVIHFKKNALHAAWLTLVVIAALMVAIKSASRGQLIFSILSLVLVMPISWNRFSLKNALIVGLAGILLVLLTAFIFTFLDASSDRWKISEILFDVTERFAMAKDLLSAWVNSPLAIIFGLGSSASHSPDIVGYYPHIVPLEVLGEEGTIGFVLLCLIIYRVKKQASLIRAESDLPESVRVVFAANLGCFIFALLLSLKQGSLIASPDLFLFAIIGEKYFYLVRRHLNQTNNGYIEKNII